MGARIMPFYHSFLDDYLRGIMPNRLILIGAESGAGKTELARSICASNAANGKRVCYVALEAEPLEIERRTLFQIIGDLVLQRSIQIPGGLNYVDWYRGALEPYLREVNADALDTMNERYKTFSVYYRGSKFDHETVQRLFLAHQDTADLLALDHLHYVDIADDDENRGLKHLITVMRNLAISIGKPILLVAHLRKKDDKAARIVPSLADFHGSSDISKVATDAIMLAPAWSVPSSRRGFANTFFSIPKAREAGATNLIALCPFDTRRRVYDSSYTLGRQLKGKFEPFGTHEVPAWAKHHEAMSVPMGAGE